jgi:hypothetical protein
MRKYGKDKRSRRRRRQTEGREKSNQSGSNVVITGLSSDINISSMIWRYRLTRLDLPGSGMVNRLRSQLGDAGLSKLFSLSL